jgi:4-amino-4-deoxy-L-arabinose transferase
MSSLIHFLQKKSGLLLLLFFVVVYFLPLNNRMLASPDEVRYAEISREMIQSGDWVVPHLLGLVYFEKPVAGYWFNNISQLLFGETRFSVRFATALSTGLTGLLLYGFSFYLFQSRKKAFAAAACYLSCLEVYAVGTFSLLDAMFTLWFNLSLIAFYCGLQANHLRKKILSYVLAGAASGLAFLTKGFIGLLVPALVALPYLVYRRQLKELYYLWVAFLSMLVVSLPWAILVHVRAPDYWHYFFWEEHIKRFASVQAQHKEPLLYYLPVLLLGSLPWLGVLPSALRQIGRESSLRPAVVFLFLWAIIPLVFFSIAKGKLPTYILTCFAPLAILLGSGLVELIEKQKWRSIRINAGMNILFGLLVTLALSLLAGGILGDKTYYADTEKMKLYVAFGLFIFWALMGVLSYRRPAHSVGLTMLCPLAFGLFLNFASPESAIYSKQPEAFVNEHKQLLQTTRLILSDDPGLAYSLAWELKRSDIRIYRISLELSYGLDHDSSPDKFLSEEQFPDWLASVKSQEDVVVLFHNNREHIPDIFRTADHVYTHHYLSLYHFKSSKTAVQNE